MSSVRSNKSESKNAAYSKPNTKRKIVSIASSYAHGIDTSDAKGKSSKTSFAAKKPPRTKELAANSLPKAAFSNANSKIV